jgi:WD40 repeat protein
VMRSLSTLLLLACTGGLPGWGQQIAEPATRTDLYGDPLPAGALARLGTVRLRHPGRVFALAFSPDGKTLAVFNGEHSGYRGLGWGGKSRGAIHIWDTTTGKRIRQLSDSQQGVPALGFAADGKLLWTRGTGVKVFDPATSKEANVPTELAPSYRVALSPDGTLAAVGSKEAIHLVTVRNGKEIRKLDLPAEHSGSVAFSPDGATVAASFGLDRTDHGVCLWDVATGLLRRKLPPESAGDRIALTPDGKTAATVWSGRPVRLWDVAAGKQLRTLGDAGVTWFAAFSGDGKALIVVRNDGVVLWDVATGNELRRFGARHMSYYAAALSPDGKLLALGDGGAVRFFQVSTGKELLAFAAPVGEVEAVGFAPDGKTAFTGSDGLAVWDTATGKRLAAPGPRAKVGAAAFSPDGRAILAGYSEAQELRLLEAATGKDLRRFAGNPGEVEFVGFLGDGKLGVSMSQHHSPKTGTFVREKSLRLWDLATGKETRKIGNGMMHRATISADGRRLAAGMHELYVWDALSEREVAKLSKPPNRPLALALTPDGRRLAMASFIDKRTVRLWEILTGKETGTIPGHDAAILALGVSPDGRILATGGAEGTVGLWDLATGNELRKLMGHEGPVLAVAFSADGRRLLSGSRDTTALIWDVADALPKAPAARLEAAELKELWATLAGTDGAAALRAVRRLAEDPGQALPYLHAHLDRPPAVDRDRLARMLADLDADSFARREKAIAELARLGPLAEPGLRRLLENKPSAEGRRRAEMLLKNLEARQVSPAVLQAVRALEVLEQIATPKARQLIAAMAEASAEARVCEEARAALARLARR